MDTSVLIIGLVLLVIVAVPLYFVLRGQKIDQKKIKALFAQHSQGNQYQFQLVAANNRKVLGMDTQKKGLLFIDFNLTEPFVAFQDLKRSESCEVAISNAPGRTNALEKVEWIFMSKNGKPAENSVVFHDSDKNYIVPVYAHEELQLARQWQQAIQQHI